MRFYSGDACRFNEESVNLSKADVSIQNSTHMEELIPVNEISTLSQSEFVGQVTDTMDNKISQKTFYSKVKINLQKRKYFEENIIPTIANFSKKDEKKILEENFRSIKSDIKYISHTFSLILK